MQSGAAFALHTSSRCKPQSLNASFRSALHADVCCLLFSAGWQCACAWDWMESERECHYIDRRVAFRRLVFVRVWLCCRWLAYECNTNPTRVCVCVQMGDIRSSQTYTVYATDTSEQPFERSTFLLSILLNSFVGPGMAHIAGILSVVLEPRTIPSLHSHSLHSHTEAWSNKSARIHTYVAAVGLVSRCLYAYYTHRLWASAR